MYTLHSLDMCGLLRQGKRITPFAILPRGLIAYPVQLWRELGQSACPQLSLQDARANGCTSSVKAMPFTQSKSNPNHNGPAVISLLQLTITSPSPSKIARVPSSTDKFFEFFRDLVVALKCRVDCFGENICFLGEEVERK